MIFEVWKPWARLAFLQPEIWEYPLLSFLMPVEDEETGERFGALLGRTRLDVNPVMRRVLASLQWTRARGEGFVVDAEGRIVAHFYRRTARRQGMGR